VRYERNEAISLAFVTALQLLPARQRAVLILREVNGYRASEVAEMLDSSVESVNGALKRARATLQERKPATNEHEPPPAPDSPEEQACVAKFVRAYQSGDIDALVAMLTDDVCLSMPPIPFEYTGRDVVGRFYARLVPKRPYELVPTRANGQPALVAYLRGPDGTRHGRPHPQWRQDLRHHPLRERRAPLVRAVTHAPLTRIIRDDVASLRRDCFVAS
jgi:ketosteroid isomerase-like protein